MELVYLWVEEYKNIKKQGFNFSPRFNCKYDENTNELTIDENDDYIDGFFGDNINVTAIVGKNGSGKSSILELMMKIANKFTSLKFKCFFIYKKDNLLYIVGNPKCLPQNYQDYCQYSSFRDENESINWLNYTNTKDDRQLAKYIERQSYFNQFGSNFIFKQVTVYSKYTNILKMMKDKYLFNKFQLQMGLKSEAIIEETDFEGKCILNDSDIKKCQQIITKIYDGKEFLDRKSISSKPLSKENQLIHNSFLFYVYFFNIHNQKSLEDDFSSSLDRLLEASKITLKEIFKILNNFKNILNKFDNYIFELFQENLKELIYLKENIDKFDYKNHIYVWQVDLKDKKSINEIINNTCTISGISTDDIYMGDCIFYEFINDEQNFHYNDLSEGEKEILKISVDFIYHLAVNTNKNVVFLVDEIDNSLHPTWKREILKIQIDLFLEFRKLQSATSIHLLLTTHSPFLISDLPKQNIIFLKDGKQVKGTEKKQTFGANIHTLLSDSFFMEDGLMGEFAKAKIDEVIDYLNNKDTKIKDDEQAQQLIDIIGEPIVKNQLQKMLDSKRLSKVDKIDKIEEEILALQKELKGLKDGQK